MSVECCIEDGARVARLTHEDVYVDMTMANRIHTPKWKSRADPVQNQNAYKEERHDTQMTIIG